MQCYDIALTFTTLPQPHVPAGLSVNLFDVCPVAIGDISAVRGQAGNKAPFKRAHERCR